MSSPLSYSSIGKARDGSPIPLAGSLSFHSRYNPLREAEQFAASYGKSGQEAPDFFIVPGLCGGYHIEALLKRFPGVEIVAIENSPEDIGFLSAIPCVSRLTENRHVHITSTDTLQTLLPQVFFPAEHSHLQIAPLRAWEQCFPDSAKKAADGS